MSLTRRLLAVASVVMLALFATVGVIVESAMREAVEAQLRQRLEAHVYALLAAADPGSNGALALPEELPEPRLMQPDSGLYARVDGADFAWESPSTIGEEPQLPRTPLAPGQVEFLPHADIGPERAFVFRQGIAWDLGEGGPRQFVVSVAEHERFFERQVRTFRVALFGWMAAALAVFAILQWLLLRWSLSPLRRLGREVAQVKGGRQERIAGSYPREVEPLTTSLNAFIDSERQNLERQRHLLADLAHSLKTPLAVLRAAAEGEGNGDALEQVDRMDEIVAYQLRRGRASGRPTWAAPVALEPVAERIVSALERVYRNSGICCEFDLSPHASFTGEEGDLTEILGNLLENAFKFAHSQVLLTAIMREDNPRPLELVVEDDGPGVPETQRCEIMRRGVRADERVPGHGLGLAIVMDILESYDGALQVTRSERLGGAQFTLELP